MNLQGLEEPVIKSSISKSQDTLSFVKSIRTKALWNEWGTLFTERNGVVMNTPSANILK